MTVRTRFAPSPTGYLHIGGVRTALFNYLLARQSGGQFILRIDDTDQQRNVVEALQPILDGFRWLGIEWDEGPETDGPHAPYYQSQRSELYAAAVEKLLADGNAYRDYAKAEELAELRSAAEKSGQPWTYDRRWMANNDEEAAKFESEGRQAVVRLKMPRDGKCEFTDLVRGPVEFEWSGEQDTVIQRADGTCLYHLASVVDDAAFKITHVVRAVEHLSNTPRQIFIAQCLGYPLPLYAHLPYVAEPNGTAKLSKRKLDKYLKQKDFADLNELGQRVAAEIELATTTESFNPVVVDFYRETGFLPDAILNYLLLLGWSLDGQREDFSMEEAIEHFSLDRAVKSPASFDPQKLIAFQARKMSELPLETRIQMVAPFASAKGWLTDELSKQRIAKIVTAADNRLKIAADILDYEDFFVSPGQLNYDQNAWDKKVATDTEAVELVKEFRSDLAELDDFSVESIDAAFHSFLERKKIKFKHIVHALRLMLTGKAKGFGMMDTIAIIGKSESLARIDHSLQRLA